MTAITDRQTAIPTTPPPGWEREIPKYRVSRDIRPAQKDRFRFEGPFAHSFDSDVWQYGERVLKAREIIMTRAWPHASFIPLNYSAKKVHDFFTTRMKSRLPRSPYVGDRIRLDDGLSGTTVVNPVPPQLEPMDLRSAS